VVAPLPARGGQFTLPGCDPARTYPVLFLDAKNKLGAVAEVPGDQAAERPDVRLEPCGAARVRVLDADGQPAAGCRLEVEMLLEPDAPAGDAAARSARPALADPYLASWVDPLNYLHGPVTDDDGRATLPALVPGARYRVLARHGRAWRASAESFTVRPGETLILPDLRWRPTPPR
jgi:hypothetical protein